MQGSKKLHKEEAPERQMDGFIASVDWWNATYVCRVELSE